MVVFVAAAFANIQPLEPQVAWTINTTDEMFPIASFHVRRDSLHACILKMEKENASFDHEGPLRVLESPLNLTLNLLLHLSLDCIRVKGMVSVKLRGGGGGGWFS